MGFRFTAIQFGLELAWRHSTAAIVSVTISVKCRFDDIPPGGTGGGIMVSLTNSAAATDRLGRSVQAAARERYRQHTAVLERGLPPARQTRDVPVVSEESSLAGRIGQAVQSQLPLRTEPEAYRDYDSLAADYSASVEFLRAAVADVRHFVDALLKFNCTYSSSGTENTKLRQEFLDAYYGGLTKAALAFLTPPPVILSAELEGLPVELAAVELRERLERLVARFSEGVAAAFLELQAAELVGRIDWPVPTACDAFYFEDTVQHEHLGREVTKHEKDVEFDYDRMVKHVRGEVKTVEKDRHVVRHGLHLKVVGNARQHAIDAYAGVVPVDVRRLLKVIPPWMRGLVQIVEGTTRTDLLVARDIYVEEQEIGETESREWLEPCFCPLITIGDYVLTGWGAREDNIEVARRNYGWLYLLAGALVFVAAICTGLGELVGSLLGYVAPVAATLSLVAFVEACREKAIARQEHATVGKLISVGLAWLVFSLGLMALGSGLATSNWFSGGMGACVTIAGGVLLWRVFAGRTIEKQ